ncbi:MAG: DegT/DnrJ/EryC1/StrS family aminotransferase [Treponema sp.]|nr:DegT/DnrJ/EryC1/StrS family aminotransferase [Treponema sp.]
MYRWGKEEAEAAARVIMAGSMFRIKSKYNEVFGFETEFKKKIGAAHCIAMNSGTGAITAALAALGVEPGCEVIIPAYTFIATASAVLSVGAIPVICEVDSSLTMDPDDVEKKISKYTKAIIPVDIAGFPCDMDRLMALSKKYGLAVVEDACQADGGSYKGRRLGSIGDIGAFSFNQAKIISAGEGGALVTNNLKLFERAVIFHDVGAPFWPYEQPISAAPFNGRNYRVTEVTGAILREQLKRLDGILADLRRVKKTIMDAVKDVVNFAPSNDIEGDCGVQLPFQFSAIEQAIKFEKQIGAERPINTGRHVYSNWSSILEKRGGHSEGANPYTYPANRGLNMDFNKNSCPKSLDYLSRTVYLKINPDWTDAEIEEKIKLVRSSK